METDTVKIEPSNAEGVFRQKERIERLFNVKLEIVEHPETSSDNRTPRICTCTLSAQKPNAKGNITKARKYLQALTADGADFSIRTENYDHTVIKHILIQKDNIERECCAIITASRGNNTISIKGSKQDVERTKLVTDAIASALICSEDCQDFELQQQPAYADDGYGMKSGKNERNLSVESDSSEEIDVETDIKGDPDYQHKLEFAFKLGYNESDLLTALKKLGKSAGQNDLLSELIKNNATRQNSGESVDSDIVAAEDEAPDTQGGPDRVADDSPFRHIIIDGSNVAMSHGNKEIFSCQGIRLAVDWFRERGHTNITVFVPLWRKETSRSDSRISDQHILNALEKEKVLVFTPSRRIGGKRVVCHDDRYILKLAVETNGIVVSNDHYREFIGENEQFKKVVEERLLMYSFANDRFMPPDDPLGRNGPTLDNFLLKEPAEPEPLPPPCPYGSKKCTYGNKCKYYHPERRTQPHRSVTDKLAEQAKQRMQEMRQRDSTQSPDGKKKLTRTKTPLQRTSSATPQCTSHQPLDKNQAVGMDDYNQKLSESLMKMDLERAISEPFKLPFPHRTHEKVEYSSGARFGDTADSRASPRMLELKQGSAASSREASPVNLSVPEVIEDMDDGQKFVSGHLALAKKLSDEANESDKLRKKQRAKVEDGQTGVSLLGFNVVEGQKEVFKKPLTRSKEKVSRQLSLQGGEDPRLAQSRLPVHAQLSYDPRRITGDVMGAMNPKEREMLLKDFMSVQQRNLMSEGTTLENSSHKKKTLNMTGGHASVTRMQSAPDPSLQNQAPVRQMPVMTRQNSSSDTQLNRLCSYDYDNFDSQHARASRESLPMKDSSGTVTFQIGGPIPMPRNQPQTQVTQGMHMDFHGQTFFSRHSDGLKQQAAQPNFPSSPHSHVYPSGQTTHFSSAHIMSAEYFPSQPLTVSPNYPLQQPGAFQHQRQSVSPISPPRKQNTSQNFQPHHNMLHYQSAQQNIQDYQGGQQTVSQGYQHFSPNISPNYPHVQHSMSQEYFPQSSTPAMPRQLSDIGHVQTGFTYSSGSVQIPEASNVWNTKAQQMQNAGQFQQQFVQSNPSSQVPVNQTHYPRSLNASPMPCAPLVSDTPVLQDNPRYGLYLSLCALFPEETVRSVMNQHPDIEDPKQLCAFIISRE